MKKLLLLLLLPAFSQAQTASNDMFRATVVGNLVTLESLQPCPIVIDGSIGSKIFDTTFTLNGTASFTLAGNISGQTLRFRTHTKCMQTANSSWVGFTIVAPLGLPVKINHFSAAPNGSGVQVFYYVEVSEGDAFEIQRSDDGRKWQHIFYAGSATPNSYNGKRSIVDFTATENNYYRIVLYEAGRVSYSNVLHVPLKSGDADVVLYDINGTPVQKVKASKVRQAIQAMRRGNYFGSDRKIYSNL